MACIDQMLCLSVERKPVRLPSGLCDAELVRRSVARIGPPLVVHTEFGKKKFSVRRRVYFSVNDLSVECENDAELRLACKLVALDHNRWQTSDDENLQHILAETEQMEAEAKERMEAPLSEATAQILSTRSVNMIRYLLRSGTVKSPVTSR